MEFKKCSINGKIYGNNAVAGQTDAEKGLELMGGQDPSTERGGETGGQQQQQQQGSESKDDKQAVLKEYDQEVRKIFKPAYMDPLEILTFADPDIIRDLTGPGGENRSNGEGSSISAQQPGSGSAGPQHDGSPSSNIHDFFTLLALCHTVVIEQPEEELEDDEDDEFGLYADNGAPPTKDGVDENGRFVDPQQQEQPKNLGFRDKLKQKAEAHGLSVPGAETKPGTRARKNSNAPSVSASLLPGQEEKPQPTIKYRAESPDEAALVSAAKNVGFAFVSRGATANPDGGDQKAVKGNARQNVNLNILGQDHTYEQLDVIKFNSTRKRMTVIVREPQELGGKILLLTKGADNVIFERLAQVDDETLRDQTERDIEAFSNMGLRTLTLAQRILDQETYDQWAAKYAEAGKALDDRAKKMDQIAEEIERDLTLLGATAIEDKLQEGVPDSIAALREAGIKVWVLTGDKLETAINIGFASRLLEKDMKLEIMKMGRNEDPTKVLARFKDLVNGVLTGKGSHHEESSYIGERSTASEAPLNEKAEYQEPHQPSSQPQPYSAQVGGNTWDEKHLPPTPAGTSLADHEQAQQQQQSSGQGEHALIVDGSALKILLDDPEARQDLIKLSDVCFSVICCRASPLQKALVVELIRRGKKTVCLAIGDGANDVSMIQAANIGVGISGQEGMQAAMASDYSITQFRFVRKLVLVHGHWGYMRIAEMILNFFFKNVLWVAAVLWFQIYCGYVFLFIV
jgi:phospholipid-translocating ATPase